MCRFDELATPNANRQFKNSLTFLMQSSYTHIRMMQYESTKIFSLNFSFHDGYEQFTKFIARQIFPLYGIHSPDNLFMVLVSTCTFISKTHNHFWSTACILQMVHTMYVRMDARTNLYLQHCDSALRCRDKNSQAFKHSNPFNCYPGPIS